MPRESAAMKARRLLTEGRVVVVAARGRMVQSCVRGDSGTFHEVRHEGGYWTCSCENPRICSHIQATQFVTAPVRPGAQP